MKKSIGIFAGLAAALGGNTITVNMVPNDGKPLPIKVSPSKGSGRSRGRIRLGKYVPGQGSGSPKPTPGRVIFKGREGDYSLVRWTDGSLRYAGK